MTHHEESAVRSVADQGTALPASQKASPTAADRQTGRVLEPARFIRSDVDAWILTVQWIVRSSFLPSILIGLTAAGVYMLAISHDTDSFLDRLSRLSTPAEQFQALFSPFAIVVVVIAARVAISLVALASAYPLTRETTMADHGHVSRFGGHLRVWRDRWKLAHALRTIRWTWGVRNATADRLGIRRTAWRWWDRAVIVATILGVIAFIGVLFGALSTMSA